MLSHVLKAHPLAYTTDANAEWPRDGRMPPWASPKTHPASGRNESLISARFGSEYSFAEQTRFFLENYNAGLKWYANVFPPTQEGRFNFAADRTPFYYSSVSAANRIHMAIPNVAIVALVREPVARMWSHMKMLFDHSFASQAEGAADIATKVAKAQAVMLSLKKQLEKAKRMPNWATQPEAAWAAAERSGRFSSQTAWMESRYDVHLKLWKKLFPGMLLLSTEGMANMSSPVREQALKLLDNSMFPPASCRLQLLDAMNSVSLAKREAWVAEMMASDEHANSAVARAMGRPDSAEVLLGDEPPEWLVGPLRLTFAPTLQWLQQHFPEMDWKELWRY